MAESQITYKEYSNKVWNLFSPKIKHTKLAMAYLSGKLLNELTELLESKSDALASIDECGDVFWYITNLYNECGFELPNEYIEGYLSEQETLNELLIEAGKLLGMIYKQTFHDKEVYQKDVCDMLDSIYRLYRHYIFTRKFSLEDIMQFNIKKLNKRHGESYNVAFYKTT